MYALYYYIHCLQASLKLPQVWGKFGAKVGVRVPSVRYTMSPVTHDARWMVDDRAWHWWLVVAGGGEWWWQLSIMVALVVALNLEDATIDIRSGSLKIEHGLWRIICFWIIYQAGIFHFLAILDSKRVGVIRAEMAKEGNWATSSAGWLYQILRSAMNWELCSAICRIITLLSLGMWPKVAEADPINMVIALWKLRNHSWAC